jgi:hypothetical protein
MNLNLNDVAVLLLSLTALILLISHDWRLSVSSLGVLYLGVFTLVLISWPMEMAVVKLVAGWISASVLGIGLVNLGNRQYRPNRYLPSEIIFRFSAAGLVSLVAISLTPSLLELLPGASDEQTLGGLILIGMGLLILGFTQRPLQTALGLLTFFAGFEILYVTIESSVLVAGFLALINMGVALVFAYLLLAPTLEVEE